jgi:hypothetical protein
MVPGWVVTASPLIVPLSSLAGAGGGEGSLLGVPWGMATVLLGPEAGAGVAVAESSGRRTLPALPRVGGWVLFRVYVFAARAAAPVIRIPVSESTRAILGFMVQL